MRILPACFLITCFLPSIGAARPHSIFEDEWRPPKVESESSKPASQPSVVKPKTTPEDPIAHSAKLPSANLRLEVPVGSEQARVRKLMKDVFAEQLADPSPLARRKLAESLLAQVNKTSAPVEQFVLLAAAGDAAIEGGSVQLAFQAADQMGKTFDVNVLGIKSEAISTMNSKAVSPQMTSENVRAALQLAKELEEADELVAAVRVCAATQTLAATNAELRSEVQNRFRELSQARDAAERVSRDVDKLKSSPDDPAANLAVGRYLCFLKDDWKRGLPMLAKGSDRSLRVLAKRELAAAESAEAIADVADAWWSAAKEYDEVMRAAVMAHATTLYQHAEKGIAGLRRTQIEKRISDAIKVSADPEGLLDKAEFLDWKRETWKNDIRGEFTIAAREKGIAVSIKAEGYEHKLILFDKIDPHRRKLTFRIKVESGELGVGFRPLDLAPQGFQLKKKLPAGKTVEVKLWIEGNRATAEVDGIAAELEGENKKLGWVALMPSRSCRFVIEQIAASGRQ